MKIEYNQPISDFLIRHRRGKHAVFFEDFARDDEKENAVVQLESIDDAKIMQTCFYSYKKRNPEIAACIKACIRKNVFVIWKEKK